MDELVCMRGKVAAILMNLETEHPVPVGKQPKTKERWRTNNEMEKAYDRMKG